MNVNIWKEASKGGKARWKGVSMQVKIEQGRKAGTISAALKKERRRLLDKAAKEMQG